MVSRLEPRKGYPFLLQAAARLVGEFPSLRVLIVGEGEQEGELRTTTQRMGLTDRVVFAGYRTDVAEVIAAFDIAVLTSLWEGLPRVLVQYSLLEKPIVTFDVEGSAEVVEEGNSGYIVPKEDVAALTDRLRILLANEMLRRRMGAAGRSRVEGRWDVEGMMRRLRAVYRQVESKKIPSAVHD
jgi:glycosyltransferase involved in cell wall biosynthesis